MGGFGGGGQQASPPTLDVGQSAQLLERQFQLQQQYLPSMARTAGGASRSEYRRNIDFGLGLLGDNRLRQRYEAAMPEETQRRGALLDQLDASQAASPEYQRMQAELADGGELGRRLMGEALQRSERGFGVLSPEAQREATQAARSAMAARGLATGNAGIGAELLNRDRYQRARAAEDINFASGVMADQRGRFATSAQAAEQERARGLGLRQDAYNFSLSSNPNMMAIGAGSPYANLTQPAMQMVGSAGGLSPMYSGGQFSSGNQGMNMLAGGLGGGLSGAAMGFQVGGPWGAGIGGALGLGAGLLGSAR